MAHYSFLQPASSLTGAPCHHWIKKSQLRLPQKPSLRLLGAVPVLCAGFRDPGPFTAYDSRQSPAVPVPQRSPSPVYVPKFYRENIRCGVVSFTGRRDAAYS